MLNDHILTFYDMTRCLGICLPYCCAGSRPISDSDISDFDVDDAIGVSRCVDEQHGPAFFFFFFGCLLFFLYSILEY